MSKESCFLSIKFKIQSHFAYCLIIFILIDLATVAYISSDLFEMENTNSPYYLITVLIIYLSNIIFFALFFRDRVNEILGVISSIWILALSITAPVYFLRSGQSFDIINIIKKLPDDYYFTFLIIACLYSLYRFINELFNSKKIDSKDEIINLILKLKKANLQDSNVENKIDSIIKRITIVLNYKYNNLKTDNYSAIDNVIQLNGIKSQILIINKNTKNVEIKKLYTQLMNTTLKNLIEMQPNNIS